MEKIMMQYKTDDLTTKEKNHKKFTGALMAALFLFFTVPFVQVYAQERVTYIDTPKVSTGIDIQNEKPLNSINRIPQNTDKIYASTFSHNAFGDDEISIKWYFHKDGKSILIKKQAIDATSYEFIYASLQSKQENFPLGQYKVVFQIGMSTPKVASFDVVAVKHSKNKYSKIWHYDTSEFSGWSKIKNNKVIITDVSIQKKSWNKKEKRVALIVKTNAKTFRDEFIFCQKDKNYYYCSIEDDGGYIKIDKDMNIQLNVEFSKETEEGLISELSIVQKQKNRWIPPITSKQKECSTFNKQADKEIFFKVLKRYPEFTIDDIKIHKPGRHYDAKHGVSIVAPQGWNSITKEGDAILYLIQGNDAETSRFMFKVLAKFWDEEQSKKPRSLIKKAAKLIGEIFAEDATNSGDQSELIGSIKIFSHNKNTIAHFVSHRTGKKTRWESNTLIWDGKELYLLALMSKEDELLLGEFLSSLAMESFCSETSRRK